MTDGLATALGFGIVAIAFFSYLGVNAWASARQREREAYYRSEAIKKLAEMQGSVTEPVLELLRDALKPPATGPNAAVVSPSVMKAFYRSETLKRVAEMKGDDAEGVVAVMREEERRAARRARESLKLSSLILVALGIALIGFLKMLTPDVPVYMVGLIPLLLGAAMTIYIVFLAPRVD